MNVKKEDNVTNLYRTTMAQGDLDSRKYSHIVVRYGYIVFISFSSTLNILLPSKPVRIIDKNSTISLVSGPSIIIFK